MSRWFRHYAGMMRDEKLVRVAVKAGQSVERVIWIWGALLESASEVNDGGRYDFDADEAAYFLRCDATDIRAVTAVLEAMGHLHEGSVVKWGDRQFDSDSSRERQKRYRDRQRTQNDGHVDGQVTPRDGGVTLQEDRVQITDTSSLRSEVAREEDDEFNETFWPAYPHKVGKPAALKAFRGAKKRAKLPEIMAGLQRYIAAKPPDRPWCNPATFLNQDRWNDQPAAVAPRPNGTGPPQSMAAKLVALTDQPIEKTLNDYLAKHGDHSAASDAEGNPGPAPPAVRTIPNAGR
jgi:hypothetical protein